MAASFLWASRVASHLRTSVAQRGFSSGETQSHSFLSVSFLWFLSLLLNLILFFLKVCVFDSKCVFDSDINSPVSGTVVEVNEVLTESPELILLLELTDPAVSSPYEEGWIIKVELSDAGKAEKLMDSDKYSKFCEEEDAKH
uniref:Lipoyl-binding domain-containing protein n=1 Tax=Brassica campestris TaxID=3711 RepID=M4DLF1_BRACM